MTAPSSTEAGNVPPRQERKDMLEVIKVWGGGETGLFGGFSDIVLFLAHHREDRAIRRRICGSWLDTKMYSRGGDG